MRTSKKEYIRDLEYIVEEFEKELLNKKQFFFWFLGDRVSRYAAEKAIAENKKELEKIRTDKTYRPWNEIK